MRIYSAEYILPRWEREYTLKPKEDLWGEGTSQQGTIKGVEQPASPDAVVVDEGGYHVSYDKDFWTRERLEHEDKVVIDGSDFQIMREKNYKEYGEYYKYELKLVDAHE